MDAVENMYRIAGDDRYSDTHRNLAARAIARAGREYDMIERTGQAEYYLREARRAGLAEPVYVTVSAHDHGHFRSSQITFQMTTASDVGEWALHFGAELTTTANQASAELETGARHHDVKVYHMFNEAETSPGAFMTIDESTAAACDTITKAAQ